VRKRLVSLVEFGIVSATGRARAAVAHSLEVKSSLRV